MAGMRKHAVSQAIKRTAQTFRSKAIMLSTLFIGSIRKRQRRAEKASASSFDPSPSPGTMGNTPSSPSTPKSKPAQVVRSQTTSSLYIPGAEEQRKAPAPQPEGAPPREPSAYSVQVGVPSTSFRDLKAVFAAHDAPRDGEAKGLGLVLKDDVAGSVTPQAVSGTEVAVVLRAEPTDTASQADSHHSDDAIPYHLTASPPSSVTLVLEHEHETNSHPIEEEVHVYEKAVDGAMPPIYSNYVVGDAAVKKMEVIRLQVHVHDHDQDVAMETTPVHIHNHAVREDVEVSVPFAVPGDAHDQDVAMETTPVHIHNDTVHEDVEVSVPFPVPGDTQETPVSSPVFSDTPDPASADIISEVTELAYVQTKYEFPVFRDDATAPAHISVCVKEAAEIQVQDGALNQEYGALEPVRDQVTADAQNSGSPPRIETHDHVPACSLDIIPEHPHEQLHEAACSVPLDTTCAPSHGDAACTSSHVDVTCAPPPDELTCSPPCTDSQSCAQENLSAILKPNEPVQYTWTPGTYVLVNAKSGTALDLSVGDLRALTGWPLHGNQNQQWEFIPSGRGYMIRSACSSSSGLYLTVADGLCENAALVATPFPVSWDVQMIEHESAIRIAWPNTDYVLDLADWGCEAAGTKVQLMRHKPGEPCQMWRFIPRPAPLDVVEKSAQSTMPPILAETVIVSEEADFVTTTRTTTTTTITTVTIITKTARQKAF